MGRPPLWTAIGEALRKDLADRVYRPGDRLPTEAKLAERFGVNRHTIRRALGVLAADGAVHARRGSGVFVSARATDYPLGRRVRFHRNIAATGQSPSRRLTRIETVSAGASEAAALGLGPGQRVHLIEGVSSADDVPIAVFRSVYPAIRFPGLPDAIATRPTLSDALASCGLADYTRQDTRLTAVAADAILADALRLRTGDPLIRSVAINVDASGVPVEYGTTWFAGDRVTLTISTDQP